MSHDDESWCSAACSYLCACAGVQTCPSHGVTNTAAQPLPALTLLSGTRSGRLDLGLVFLLLGIPGIEAGETEVPTGRVWPCLIDATAVARR